MAYSMTLGCFPFFYFRPLIHGNRYMKIFVNKPLENSKKLSEITKSIKKTENNHKNSFFDLGRNPLEIVHGPFKKVIGKVLFGKKKVNESI
jgi:hypothetical protein